MTVSVPFIEEAAIMVSGYRGVDIWFVGGVQSESEGAAAQHFREVELTGTKITSILKAEIILMPIVLIFSFFYWSVLWRIAPIPSARYPYAQKMWKPQAQQQCLWLTVVMGGGVRENTIVIRDGVKKGEKGITEWAPPLPNCKNTIWYWRCRAYDGRCDSEWSETGKFYVKEISDGPEEDKKEKHFLSRFMSTSKRQLNHYDFNHYPTVPVILEKEKRFKKGERIVLAVKNSTDPDKRDKLSYVFEADRTPDFSSDDRIITQTQSEFLRKFSPKYALIGLLGALIAFFLFNSFALPTMTIFGFISGVGGLNLSGLLYLGGAFTGRYYFAKKFGKQWYKMVPILVAGCGCGMGMVSMLGVALNLITKSVSTLGF
jgi:hypothetical protein